MVLRPCRRVVEAEVEDRALPREPVGGVTVAPPERGLEALEHPLARGAGRVERAALDERLERALVRDRRVDALGEVPDRLERAVLLARGDDRARRAVADVLHGVEAEADLALDDGEVALREVDVGRQHLDPHLVARVDVERHAVLRVHHRRDERRHVLARVVRAQPRRAVRDQRVTRRVRLVEGVVLRLLHVLPELLRDAPASCPSARSPRGTSPSATPSASGSSCRSPCADRRPRRARSRRIFFAISRYCSW